jgi:hypothetical protein
MHFFLLRLLIFIERYYLVNEIQCGGFGCGVFHKVRFKLWSARILLHYPLMYSQTRL